MKFISLSAAFILELIAFVGFASAGFLLPVSNVFHIISFVVLLSILIVFWSLYMAPHASQKFSVVPYYVAKLLIYAIAAFMLLESKGAAICIIFILVFLTDELLLFKHNAAKTRA